MIGHFYPSEKVHELCDADFLPVINGGGGKYGIPLHPSGSGKCHKKLVQISQDTVVKYSPLSRFPDE